MKGVLDKALRRGAAVPAFNFYNLESLRAIVDAARAARAPVILAASEGAIKYMGADFVRWAAAQYPLHLDHGRSFEACKNAISLGFQSVMIDGSRLPFAENVKLTRRVVQYAHKRGVWVEAELGAIGGVEDGAGAAKPRAYNLDPAVKPRDDKGITDPEQAKMFVKSTGCDSLAVAIGTAHGAYKRDSGFGIRDSGFDILKEIRRLLPHVPLVLHGASQIPQKYVKILGLSDASGTSGADIRRAVKLGINKVNVDSDGRLAWTAAMKQMFAKKSDGFDPRKYLAAASAEMVELYKKEIKLINKNRNT